MKNYKVVACIAKEHGEEEYPVFVKDVNDEVEAEYNAKHYLITKGFSLNSIKSVTEI